MADIKNNIKRVGYSGVDWIRMTYIMAQWWVFWLW